jgi:uncharacterized protein
MMDRPTKSERKRSLPGDCVVGDSAGQVMHAVTIEAPPESVWPWLVQMGGGRAGWYSYDWIDNDGEPSATAIVPSLQHLAVGDIMPSLPGASDSFVVAAIDPFRSLILTASSTDGSALASWEFFLEPVEKHQTRLMVRGRVAARWPGDVSSKPLSVSRPIEVVYWLLAHMPRWLMTPVAMLGHGAMQVHQLQGIKRRAEGAEARRIAGGVFSRGDTTASGRTSVGSVAAQGSEFNGIRAWIAKRPAVSFYVLTLMLSWVYWLTLLALGLRVGPGSVSHFPGLLGPMLAAMAVTAVIGGRKALLELFGRMFLLGPRWAAKLMLALSPLGLGAVACIAIVLLGKPLPSLSAFAHVPGLPEGWPLAAVLAVVIVVNGFGEETGWRGFLTERLLQVHGRMRAALWVGFLWALWHLPLFWLNTGMTSLIGPVLIGWLFALVCGAFVLTYVYIATGHSILCVALWHVAFNMMVSSEVDTGFFAGIVSTLVIAWGTIIALLWWRTARGPTEAN